MKTYKRKIHLYVMQGGQWVYFCSSNKYRTCRDAQASLATLYPNKAFKANFAKD